jgi:hypothetical protein
LSSDTESACDQAIDQFLSHAFEGLPIRAQLLGLDQAGAEAAFERGQGQARQYQQTR